MTPPVHEIASHKLRGSAAGHLGQPAGGGPAEASLQTGWRQNGLTQPVTDGISFRAAQYMRIERALRSLQPTALVHEAYLRLVEVRSANWQDRVHFFA
jgi:hypothetical protein